jgi:hypothetical protein
MLSKLLPTLRSALVCTLTLAATASFAATLNVGPGQPYTTIQSAINAAANGDTVLVAPGTYFENINFIGKAITVTSSGGAALTTIDGGSKGGQATVIFNSGETRASVISGFTIRGGGDSLFAGNSDGGVYAGGASPTIKGNTITANYCHNIDIEFGAAAIIDNEVSGVLQDTNNSQGQSYCTFGSAVHLQGTPYTGQWNIVVGNTIENNLTGSGVNLWAAQNVVVQSNIIRNNTSPDPGSAFISVNDNGTVFIQNLVYGNTSNCGGALSFMETGLSPANPSILIANNTIVDNVTPIATGGSECTAISQIYPSPYAYGSSGPGALIVNNIVSGSTTYPAVNCSSFEAPSESRQPTFQNNILYNASGPFFGSHCIDVSGKYNNIVADPQFVSPSTGDYHLRITSPAIDRGLNSALQTFLSISGKSLTTDFDGNPRIQNATGSGCTVDMGAYEYPGTLTACSITETLTSSLNPSTFGQTVTFTAQLSSSNGVPTGVIEFTDGSTSLGTETISSAGVSTFTTGTLTVGSHSITAIYQPTGTFSATSASLTQVVNGLATTSSITCTPNPITVSATSLCTIRVTSANGTPTGSVTLTDNGTTLATLTLSNGSAAYTYTGTAAGTHTLTASYPTTGTFNASTNSFALTVDGLPTTTTASVLPEPSTYGQPTVFTVHVAPVTPTAAVPTGKVLLTFCNGATITLTLDATGSGSVTTPYGNILPEPVGSCPFTANYQGDTTFNSSTSASIPYIVNPSPSTTTIVATPNPAYALNPVTVTVTVTGTPSPTLGPGGQIIPSPTVMATGTVSLLDGTTFVGTAKLSNGIATFTVTTLAIGQHTLTANFAPDFNLTASSASTTETILPNNTSTTLTATPNPAYLSQTVTIVATVASSSTSAPGSIGTITFYDGTTVLGTQPVTAAFTATFTTSTLAIGSHPITATFTPANAAFTPSTSTPVNEVILPSGFSIALSPSTITLSAGASGTTTIQLASIGNFAGPLTLTSGTPPTYATVAINPATVTLAAGGSTTSTLSIKTLFKAANAVPTRPSSKELPVVFAAITLLFVPFALRRRKTFTRLLTLALAIVALQTITGCTNSFYIADFVAAGTYQLPVTATDANNNSQTATLTVVVTP